MWKRKSKRGPSESEMALKEATEQLRVVKARNPEVHAIASALKAMRDRNHFAETLQVIIEGNK